MSESMNVRDDFLNEAQTLGENLDKLPDHQAVRTHIDRIKFLVKLANSGMDEIDMIHEYIAGTVGGEFDVEINAA